MLRSTLFSAWQGWLGFVSALVYLLAQSELLATVIPGFPEVPMAGLIGSMLWLLWMIVLGVVLLRYLRRRSNRPVKWRRVCRRIKD